MHLPALQTSLHTIFGFAIFSADAENSLVFGLPGCLNYGLLREIAGLIL